MMQTCILDNRNSINALLLAQKVVRYSEVDIN